MSRQDDDEEHEQHPVDDGVDEDGQAAGPEVHEVDRPLPAGQLEDPSRAQQGEQRRCYDRRRPVVHLATELRERGTGELSKRVTRSRILCREIRKTGGKAGHRMPSITIL